MEDPGTDGSFWEVVFSPHYEVLGPFPISAREQSVLSPLYPIRNIRSLRHQYSLQRFPSSLVDGGFASWLNCEASSGEFKVVHSGVRWQELRNILGWSSLQNHSVVHTSFTVMQPLPFTVNPDQPVALEVTLKQGSYIAILERNRETQTEDMSWYEGDIYAQSSSPLRLPLRALTQYEGPVTFDVFISADYEIRLFGDPLCNESRSEPVSRVNLSLNIISPTTPLFDAQFTVPDILGGLFLGDVIGLRIQNTSHWRTLNAITCDLSEFSLSLELDSSRLAPWQLRAGAELRYNIPLTHHSKLASDHGPSRTHYLQTHRHPVLSSSIIIPPVSCPEEIGHQYPAVLALHGAGVDFRSPMWTTAINRQEHSWIVCPSGLSYWGYDWHGPSAADAIAALNALISREPGGTVHLCQHYPDLVLGAIPVAQYLTPSAYVPLSGSHGEHYVDPALSAILRASTANGDNDLFLSNLTEMKVRIFHGGADENVPVWQSRKVMETIKFHSHRPMSRKAL
ncbi:uncharacterized protein EI90DRAFT_3065948 [Cantharellus anzutake]|uniref:uncharacterized protein n=1 Tax=Cantharellus anzutake TaxID=1750568 RepID=UPI001907B107|nr:uncharacterized protein EI90DRAFT_3065948 [Cantharellus anzutake]KAF8328235.1 hypothetical protein EI90DRAFT_3065948 [Cantharellus anzutake]